MKSVLGNRKLICQHATVELSPVPCKIPVTLFSSFPGPPSLPLNACLPSRSSPEPNHDAKHGETDSSP
jgi:hypothetical protein